MNVMLTPEVRKFVEAKVSAGQYASADEAVNRLLSLVQEQESLTPADVEELRAEADVGIREADERRFVPFTAEDIIAEGRSALTARRKGS